MKRRISLSQAKPTIKLHILFFDWRGLTFCRCLSWKSPISLSNIPEDLSTCPAPSYESAKVSSFCLNKNEKLWDLFNTEQYEGFNFVSRERCTCTSCTRAWRTNRRAMGLWFCIFCGWRFSRHVAIKRTVTFVKGKQENGQGFLWRNGGKCCGMKRTIWGFSEIGVLC